MPSTPPMTKTYEYYKELGYICGNVEKYVPKAKKKFDLFGIIDVVAISDVDTIGVQVCKADFAAHDKKILASENSPKWLQAGRRLVLIGWTKQKVKRGGKAMIYKSRIKEYTLEDFNSKGAYGDENYPWSEI